ncbi:hypothetical protein JCM8097_004048 [Rhodosporidiobolus ruineniae]
MLDRLPPELLLPILRFAAPLTNGVDWSYIDTEAYSGRRITLMRVCLVNKRLCALAQPMLPEVFAARSEGAVDVLRSSRSGNILGHQVKLLHVNGGRYRGSPEKQEWVHAAVGLCPLVEELHVVSCSRVDLNWLADYRRLKRLVVYGTFVTTSDILPLSSITTLSLCYITMADSSTLGLLTQAHFPSLRILGIGDMAWFNDDGKMNCDVALEAGLAHQLDAWTTTDISRRSEYARSPSPEICGAMALVTQLERDFTDNPPDNLPFNLLHVVADQDPSTDTFLLLGRNLCHFQSFKTLDLDNAFHPDHLAPDVAEAAEAFLCECKRRDVRVVWLRPKLGSLVSPDFAEWARKERERKADEAANEA